jgi:hypothetical protein
MAIMRAAVSLTRRSGGGAAYRPNLQDGMKALGYLQNRSCLILHACRSTISLHGSFLAIP